MNSPASIIPPLSIPDRIRAIRFFSGLNQTELSRLLECSQGTVSKLENGELEPTAFHLVRMREVFGVSIDAIVDGLIPYRAIAERFSNTSLLPTRYARGAATKIKFLYPLVRAFEVRVGGEKLCKHLQTIGIKPALLADPELLVSSLLYQDLIEIYRETGGSEVRDLLREVQGCAASIQAFLPNTSNSAEEWSHPEKWNLIGNSTDDSSWGARSYANAVVKGLRAGGPVPDTSAPVNLGFRRMRA